ncbi:hypothetical protein FGW37_31090 [Streptomyces rectiverticillatus]|uniref:DUF2269 family protein n=1 Tax=Streptomyces rectiverticillatus TaxID=173860 RepID=UPI0015C34223|nr:hypothetical protein [Streptomyces rectiverticillatus]QLE75440.1 hypothetical protein FGW37_31090 [Streptomyces rectiverticillatus]
MTEFLLSIHVLAAILVLGPVAVAASLFPRYARQAASGSEDEGVRAGGIAALLHRICRGYAVVGIAVPVFGIATAAQLGVLADAWLIASLILTAIAAAILTLAVLPGQANLLARCRGTAETRPPTSAPRLSMLTGVFNLLWAVVVVLMIVRPGSTTGA